MSSPTSRSFMVHDILSLPSFDKKSPHLLNSLSQLYNLSFDSHAIPHSSLQNVTFRKNVKWWKTGMRNYFTHTSIRLDCCWVAEEEVSEPKNVASIFCQMKQEWEVLCVKKVLIYLASKEHTNQLLFTDEWEVTDISGWQWHPLYILLAQISTSVKYGKKTIVPKCDLITTKIISTICCFKISF